MKTVTEQVRAMEEANKINSQTIMTLTASNQSLNNKNIALTREINLLKQQVKNLEARPLLKEAEELRKRLNENLEKPTVKRLNHRIEELQKALVNLNDKERELDSLKSNLDTVVKEVKRLQLTLQHKDSTIAGLQSEINNLTQRMVG